jgi:hypothetical protein
MSNVFTSLSRVIHAIQNIGEEERKISKADQTTANENCLQHNETSKSMSYASVSKRASENSLDQYIPMVASNSKEWLDQETTVQMESDVIRIHSPTQSNDNMSTPVGPSNAVDIIVASVARAAAGAALADLPVAEEDCDRIIDQYFDELPNIDATHSATPPVQQIKTPRRKRTAAKGVLEDKPVRGSSYDSNPLELSALEALIERRAKGLELLFEEREHAAIRAVASARASSGLTARMSPSRSPKTPPKKGKKVSSKHLATKKKNEMKKSLSKSGKPKLKKEGTAKQSPSGKPKSTKEGAVKKSPLPSSGSKQKKSKEVETRGSKDTRGMDGQRKRLNDKVANRKVQRIRIGLLP